MARGKFNKRPGPRVDAVNADEIEQRNAKLAEIEEARAQRRGAEDEDEDKNEGEDPEKSKPKKPDAGPSTQAPAVVTSAEDHKRNMAKLAQVRKRREEAEARRKLQEEDEVKRAEDERKLLLEATSSNRSRAASSSKGNIPKLDKIAIKKMKPAQMKEALKERGLDIQGNAKTLQGRLLDYEASR